MSVCSVDAFFSMPCALCQVANSLGLGVCVVSLSMQHLLEGGASVLDKKRAMAIAGYVFQYHKWTTGWVMASLTSLITMHVGHLIPQMLMDGVLSEGHCML